jgi:hypothetical protein
MKILRTGREHKREELGMFEKRYGPHPKKNKQARSREGRFLERTYEWLKWKLIQVGDFSFHKPCLER